ncbi:MAG TPA: hypothetical protein V6D00_14460 [Pantanalinema sp.]
MTRSRTRHRPIHRLGAFALGGLLAGGLALAPCAQAEPLPLPSPAPIPDAERIDRDAAVRGNQLQLHQGLALATLGSMALTAGLGLYTTSLSAPEQHELFQHVHMGLGGLTTGLYLGAATLALTAPQGYALEREGWDAVTIHRSLAWLHAAALAGTVTLGILTSIGRIPPSTHGLAGGTTFGLLAVSAGVIAFDF